MDPTVDHVAFSRQVQLGGGHVYVSVFLTDTGRDFCRSTGMNTFHYRKTYYQMEPRIDFAHIYRRFRRAGESIWRNIVTAVELP